MISINDESLSDWMINTPARLKRENEVGGDLVNLPCPFCSKPRSQRSTYIRCQPCGVNWLPGDPINAHPRMKPIVGERIENAGHHKRCHCSICLKTQLSDRANDGLDELVASFQSAPGDPPRTIGRDTIAQQQRNGKLVINY